MSIIRGTVRTVGEGDDVDGVLVALAPDSPDPLPPPHEQTVMTAMTTATAARRT
jgi:hypothetical protein